MAPNETVSAVPAETAVDAATGHSAAEILDAVRAAARGADKSAIWKALKRTDPKATKPFQRAGGFRGTQIDPAWRLQMMTEVFGPVGIGWGWDQLEWTVAERMVFICCRVWYIDPDTREKYYTGPQWGGTEMVRVSRDGKERPDDECFKMSMTDALGKCLLSLGLAADIHLGQFDDSKYREESEIFYAKQRWTELERRRFEKETNKRLEDVEDLDALDELWKSGVNKDVRELGTFDSACMNRIIDSFARRKNAILKAEAKAGQDGVPDSPDEGEEPEARETAAAVPVDDAQEPRRPHLIEVRDLKTGAPLWGSFVETVRAEIERFPTVEYGEEFEEIHRELLDRLGALERPVMTGNKGQDVSGKEAAKGLRTLIRARIRKLAEEQAPAQAAE